MNFDLAKLVRAVALSRLVNHLGEVPRTPPPVNQPTSVE